MSNEDALRVLNELANQQVFILNHSAIPDFVSVLPKRYSQTRNIKVCVNIRIYNILQVQFTIAFNLSISLYKVKYIHWICFFWFSFFTQKYSYFECFPDGKIGCWDKIDGDESEEFQIIKARAPTFDQIKHELMQSRRVVEPDLVRSQVCWFCTFLSPFVSFLPGILL